MALCRIMIMMMMQQRLTSFNLNLSPPSTTTVPYANSLDPDETALFDTQATVFTNFERHCRFVKIEADEK